MVQPKRESTRRSKAGRSAQQLPKQQLPKTVKRVARPRMMIEAQPGKIMESIFTYLSGGLNGCFTAREGKRRAADAILAFWQTFALIESGADSANVQTSAQNSIRVLQRQIQEIAEAAGLNPTAFEIQRMQMLAGHVGDGASAATNGQPVGAVVVPFSPPQLATDGSKEASPELEYIIVDEDELLGDLR